MGITYGKLLYCHDVAERNVEKKISILEYNNRTVYECFNNPFTADCGNRAMHLSPIVIYYRALRFIEPDIPHI